MKFRKIPILFLVIPSILLILSCEYRRNKNLNTTFEEENDSLASSGIGSNIISTSHFYFENSASMDGYLSSTSRMKIALSRLLYALESVSQSQKFYFFNTKPHTLADITKTEDFINNLTLSNIKVGDRSTSDLNIILETVLSNTKSGDISVLATDGIYSVDASSVDDIINQLQIASERTYYKFKDRLEESNIQTVLIKLKSHFQGYYYSSNNVPTSIDHERPYYIWLFGAPDNIDLIIKEIEITDMPGYVNHVIFQVNHGLSPYYTIHSSYNKIGEFRTDNNQRTNNQVTSITHVEKDNRRGKFQFAIGVDMTGIQVRKSYLLDRTNYQINSPKYHVEEIIPVTNLKGKDADAVQESNISHVITLSTDVYPVEDIRLSLINKLPHWIISTHTTDDNGIQGDTTTTFGFQYLISGIVRAYQSVSVSQDHFNILINVKE